MPARVQLPAVLLGFLDQLRVPSEPAAVVAADDCDHLDGLRVSVAEAPHHADRHGDRVERAELDLVLALIAPEHGEPAVDRHEHLFGGVRMQSGPLARLDLDQAEAEGMLDRDRRMHRRVLEHAPADDAVELAAIARDDRVNERFRKGGELVAPCHPRLEHALDRVLLSHRCSPLLRLAGTYSAAALLCAFWMRCQIRLGLSGSSVISIPNGASASQMAFDKAPGIALGRPSPMPRLPSGVCGQGVGACVTSMSGTSAAVASL